MYQCLLHSVRPVTHHIHLYIYLLAAGLILLPDKNTLQRLCKHLDLLFIIIIFICFICFSLMILSLSKFLCYLAFMIECQNSVIYLDSLRCMCRDSLSVRERDMYCTLKLLLCCFFIPDLVTAIVLYMKTAVVLFVHM